MSGTEVGYAATRSEEEGSADDGGGHMPPIFLRTRFTAFSTDTCSASIALRTRCTTSGTDSFCLYHQLWYCDGPFSSPKMALSAIPGAAPPYEFGSALRTSQERQQRAKVRARVDTGRVKRRPRTAAPAAPAPAVSASG
eukprot:3210493-Rhodomonas_salina.3